jgi:hypothetical protein
MGEVGMIVSAAFLMIMNYAFIRLHGNQYVLRVLGGMRATKRTGPIAGRHLQVLLTNKPVLVRGES